MGILFSIQFFQDALADRSIRIFTDILVALFCLRRMGSLHSPPLDKVTRDLILFCHQRNISFVPAHIPGIQNVLAEQGSRLEPLSTEWMLDSELLESICLRILFPLKWTSSLRGKMQGYLVTFLPVQIQRHSEWMPWILLSIGIISNQYMLFLHLLSCQSLLKGFARSGA